MEPGEENANGSGKKSRENSGGSNGSRRSTGGKKRGTSGTPPKDPKQQLFNPRVRRNSLDQEEDEQVESDFGTAEEDGKDNTPKAGKRISTKKKAAGKRGSSGGSAERYGVDKREGAVGGSGADHVNRMNR